MIKVLIFSSFVCSVDFADSFDSEVKHMVLFFVWDGTTCQDQNPQKVDQTFAFTQLHSTINYHRSHSGLYRPIMK